MDGEGELSVEPESMELTEVERRLVTSRGQFRKMLQEYTIQTENKKVQESSYT